MLPHVILTGEDYSNPSALESARYPEVKWHPKIVMHLPLVLVNDASFPNYSSRWYMIRSTTLIFAWEIFRSSTCHRTVH